MINAARQLILIPPSLGTIKFIVAGEAYHTWYKTFGDFKRIGHRPLVALHGGPEIIQDVLHPLRVGSARHLVHESWGGMLHPTGGAVGHFQLSSLDGAVCTRRQRIRSTAFHHNESH
ncbi:hypothetical protein CPB85DRAFT_1303416 [Mucidula mucida]|nr:hypothetical protein CPB85DRAFT_1303416 [Mucidula mucida]